MKKIISFLVLSLLMLTSLISNAQEYLRGDVNHDGHVNVSDVTSLIYYVLNGSWPDTGNYEYVDLGLPSGTLWATTNLGATSPEDYGDYFAYGETVPKEEYTYENYKWWYFDENGYRYISKYNTKSSFGPVDNQTELEPEDDAACVNMGPSWCIPSLEQVVELLNSCTLQWTQRNGVNGLLVTGPNGNTIFLPAAGYVDGSSLEYAGTYGSYWSRSIYSYLPDRAYCLYLDSQYWDSEDFSRYYGHVIRAVRVSQTR